MKDKVIVSSLHGFMTGKSHHTKQSLQQYEYLCINNMSTSTDETKAADVVHLICSRAFDIVSHSILMQTDKVQAREIDSEVD